MDRHIRRLGIDVNHFVFNRGAPPSKTLPLSEILVKGSTYGNSSYLKKRLVKEGVLKNACDDCGISEWRGKKLSLQLDHRDGDRTNNLRENLRLLCPNCHSQTETHSKIKSRPAAKTNSCEKCSKSISKRSKTCMRCHAKGREGAGLKIEWPRDLVEMVGRSSYSAVARELGVSDVSVRKRCRRTLVSPD